MLNLLIDAVLLGIVLAVLYGLYSIPPIRRLVRNFAERYREFLFTVGFAVFAAGSSDVFYYFAQGLKQRAHLLALAPWPSATYLHSKNRRIDNDIKRL